jgi:hypothetical protein
VRWNSPGPMPNASPNPGAGYLRVIPTGSLAHPLDATGTGPGQSGDCASAQRNVA